MPRWLWFLIAAGLGIAAGLYYGWVLSPVAYVDTTPDSLRPDFRTDYVLMAAEGFHATQDIPLAARQLALLGSQPPALTAQEALVYARANNFPPPDIDLLEGLALALQTWEPPTPGNSGP